MRSQGAFVGLTVVLAMSTGCSHAVPNPVRYPVLPTRVSAEQHTALYDAYKLVCDSGSCRQGDNQAPLAASAAGAYGGSEEIYEQDQGTRRKVRWGSVGVVSVVGVAGAVLLGAVAGLVQAFWGAPDEAFEAEYSRELAQALAQRR